MNEEPGIYLITEEQARCFFDSITEPIDPEVPIKLVESVYNQSGMTRCTLIIGSATVTFRGSCGVRSVLKRLVESHEKQRSILPFLYLG